MSVPITKKNRDLINNNWNTLKCSPIGPFLQMIGVAPGNSSDSATSCKASEFSAQFNSSMTEHIAMTNKLTDGMNGISLLLDKFSKERNTTSGYIAIFKKGEPKKDNTNMKLIHNLRES